MTRRCDYSVLLASDYVNILDDLGLAGPIRHLLLEMLIAEEDHRRFVREFDHRFGLVAALGEGVVAEILGVPIEQARKLLVTASRDRLLACSADVSTGVVERVSFGDLFLNALRDAVAFQSQILTTTTRQRDGVKGATAGVKLSAHLLFEDTCELCGDKALQGKDQWGRRMQVARIKKEMSATAENVTLLCSKCARAHNGMDLPGECRTLRMLEIAQERDQKPAPRTAKPVSKPAKEIVVTATGVMFVRTRNLGHEPPIPLETQDQSGSQLNTSAERSSG